MTLRVHDGDRVDVQITASSVDGVGVGESPLDRFRVEGAYEGESVLARVTFVGKRGRVFAVTEEVETRHPARRDPICAEHWFGGGRCTGCPLMTLGIEAQLERKMKALVELGLPVDEVRRAPSEFGYRFSAKRVAFERGERVSLGSYVKRSHRLASMNDCAVDHPAIAKASAALEDFLSALGVPAYDPRSDDGLLRFVWFKTDGERVQTLLVLSEPNEALLEDLVHESASPDVKAAPFLAGGLFAGVLPPSEGNTMRPKSFVHLLGPATLKVPIGDSLHEVGPLDFLQPNPAVARDLYEHLLPSAGGSSAVELYAGAGLFTSRLRERFETVLACELQPSEAAQARGVQAADAASFLKTVDTDSSCTLIANPPRAGLGEEVCEGILNLLPKRVHIMSCGPKGLRRDLDRLTSSYELESLDAFDTLPQTPHVELIAKLRRRD